MESRADGIFAICGGDESDMWHVYLLRCADRSLYTGISLDLTKRLERHNRGRGGKYTRAKKPVALIYAEDCDTKSEALKRENEIKKLSKADKEQLVQFGKGHRFPQAKKIIFAAALIFLFPALTSAKAYFAGKKEMIEKAKAIAVVNITGTETVEQKGSHWTYRQKATGRVEQSLKGDATGPIVIHGMENFQCAHCEFQKGRFLLFLQRDGDLWAGSNWHLGIRAIKDGKVDWFKDDRPGDKMEPTPLEQVVSEIQKILAVQGDGK